MGKGGTWDAPFDKPYSSNHTVWPITEKTSCTRLKSGVTKPCRYAFGSSLRSGCYLQAVASWHVSKLLPSWHVRRMVAPNFLVAS